MDMETIRTNRWQEAVQQLLAVRRPLQAEQLVRRRLVTYPQDAHVHLLLTLTLLNQPARTTEALDSVARAIALDAESSDAHYFHSVLLLRSSQTPAALQAINEALRLDSHNARYHGYRAVVLNTNRQAADALWSANTGLAIDPSNLECLYQSILALRKLQRFREAATTIAQLAQHHPTHALSQRLLGERAQRDTHLLTAETHFREALRLDPSDSAAQDKLLRLLLDRGEQALLYRAYPTAVACFQEAVQLNSTLAVAQQLLLQALRATMWWNVPLRWASGWKSDTHDQWHRPGLADKLVGIGRALLYCLLLPVLLAFYLFSLLLDWRHKQQLAAPTPTDVWFFGGIGWGFAALTAALLPPWPPLIWLLVLGGLAFPMRNYWLRFQKGQKHFPLGVCLLLSPGGNALLKAYSLLGAANAAEDCRGFLAFFGLFLLLYQLFRPVRQYPVS
jgi:tetratricopeptide (TPR) repeat protein